MNVTDGTKITNDIKDIKDTKKSKIGFDITRI